jgi:hypothetical protein
MPINLCCDVCQGFIKHISTHDAQDMLRRKEPTVCGVCQTTRDKFRKSCEKVLVQLQRESEKSRAKVEAQFLDVMKEAIEGSINQVTKGEENGDNKSESIGTKAVSNPEQSNGISGEDSGTGSEAEGETEIQGEGEIDINEVKKSVG